MGMHAQSTAQEFLALEFEDIPTAPAEEPKSYLITTLPGATLWLAPRGKPLDPVKKYVQGVCS